MSVTIKKFKIAFVQPNFSVGPESSNTFYLPVASGQIWSQIKASDLINRYELQEIIWRREPVSPLVKRLSTYDVVCFSTYVWNGNFNKTVAAELKKSNPNVLIMFGGPEISVDDADIFKNWPFIDVVCKQEGELTVQSILQHFPNRDFSHIPGLILNQNGRLDTGPSTRVVDLNTLSSPYLDGTFDQIIDTNPSINWHAVLETNRGCPYQCTFCDWGSLTYNKTKLFDLQQVFQIIDWIGRRCGGLTIADANFGMFIDRDSAIIDKILAVYKLYSKLDHMTVTWAKNQKNEVIDIFNKLVKNAPKLANGLTVSVQSTDKQVLKIIKRQNLSDEKIKNIFKIGEQQKVPVYTELILGLPGETIQSWQQNFFNLFNMGNHFTISVYQSQLYVNAEMFTSQVKEHKLESRPLYLNRDAPKEKMDVIVSTGSLTRDDMAECIAWTGFIQLFHIQNFSNWISRYLNQTHGISYRKFYDILWNLYKNHSWCKQIIYTTNKHFHSWIEDPENVPHEELLPLLKVTQNYSGALQYNLYPTLMVHNEDKTDIIFDLVNQAFLDCVSDNGVSEQLIDFQKKTMIGYNDLKKYPMLVDYDFDFYNYIISGSNINNPVTYKLFTLEDTTVSKWEYLSLFHYARKRQYGKATVEIHNT